MAGRRGFQHRSPRSSGLSRDWGLGPGGVAQQTITASGVVILGSGVTSTGAALTLMRTRGLLHLYLTSATAAGDGYTGAMGIIVVSDQAFAAGVASMPSPANEAESNGWLYHQFLSVHAGEAGGLSGGPEGSQRVDVDSKAMRKFDSEQTVVAILEVTETGTAVANVAFDSRLLLQDSGR